MNRARMVAPRRPLDGTLSLDQEGCRLEFLNSGGEESEGVKKFPGGRDISSLECRVLHRLILFDRGLSWSLYRRAVSFLLIACAIGAADCRNGLSREEQLRQGEALYKTQGCVRCHGEHGHGDGPNARALSPPPRDFRALSAYLQGRSARDIAATLRTGIHVRSAQMPSFSHLSESERLAVGEFVASMQER
jgi:mono/diheme cytochrome c family protein